MRDPLDVLMTCAENYPQIKHLNMIKNPLNPMFSGMATKYEAFRAQFKIWLPTLQTLDGIDFSKDQVKIGEMNASVASEKQKALAGPSGGARGAAQEESKAAAGSTPT